MYVFLSGDFQLGLNSIHPPAPRETQIYAKAT